MLLHLIKKDILIAKKEILLVLLIIAVVPLFYAWAAPEMSSFFPFLYMVVIGEVTLLQSISQLEAKTPKAPALLCATPYTRKSLVKAKYAFFVLIFVYCYIVHTLLILIINPLNILDFTSVFSVLLFSAIIYGVYMPIEFKFGVVKAKFVFMVTIIVFSLGPIIFGNILSNVIKIDFSVFSTMPTTIFNSLLTLFSITVISISMLVSIKIFQHKEL